MNHKIKLIALCGLLSCTAQAHTNDNHFYAGVDAAIANNTKLSNAIEEQNDLGANIYLGYHMPINRSFDLGVEGEFRKINTVDFSPSHNIDGDAYFINLRGKLTDPDRSNPLYSGFLVGLGSLSTDENNGAQSISDSHTAYQAGLEIGYQANQFDVSVGYRVLYSKFSFDQKMVTHGLTAGVRYYF
ncbi:hypothetical protein VST7929_00031 [Vibrio stylophorae]|uniref:Outer membrane protein beta-barrel domain-containing protein n=1 Tax=Vibrio stylophorae TaxID=659351 RepID=A0ABN8DNI2_9VIBR|nr:outer membrane beta-barrel protein [Vibrio stylophorae]CAH0532220.1 hypothetical protein VST7929_00031 [Vibrio stylophorae]